MTRRWLLCGLLVAAFAAVSVSGATALDRPSAATWQSSTFVSPTHNIHCRWWEGSGLMACTTQNDDFMVAVTVWGRAWKRSYTGSYYFPSGPYLQYGDTWTASRSGEGKVMRCWSRTTGMTCRSLKTNHGFFIERSTYRLY